MGPCGAIFDGWARRCCVLRLRRLVGVTVLLGMGA